MEEIDWNEIVTIVGRMTTGLCPISISIYCGGYELAAQLPRSPPVCSL